MAKTISMPTERGLVAGGWLAMTSALLAVPWMLINFSLVDKTSLWIRSAEVVMLAGGTIIFVYLMLTLRRVLIGRYSFFLADGPLLWLVRVNVMAAVLGITGLFVQERSELLDAAGIVLIVVTGIVQILFGLRLLHLPGELRGLRKPFSYISIVTGFSLAFIILLPIGMITSAIGDVMLGTIFFQTASEMGTVE